MSKKSRDSGSRRTPKIIALIVIAAVIIAAAVAGGLWYSNYQKQAAASEYLDLGNRALEDLDYEQAIVYYNQVLDIDPSITEASMGLAEAYEGTGLTEYAESVYLDLLEEDPESAELYVKLFNLYILEDQLEKAAELMDTAVTQTDDEEVAELYLVAKPDAPSFSYAGGTYTERIRVEITAVADGQTIYYTTDGTEPTEESEIYTGGLILKNGETTIRAFAVNLEGFSSETVSETYDIDIEDVEIEFEDSVIESMVRSGLGISRSDPIYNDDVAQITALYIVDRNNTSTEENFTAYFEEESYTVSGNSYMISGSGSLTTLNDLQYMPFLESVGIAFQAAADYSALASCTNLKSLSLIGDNLTSRDLTSIAGLTSLTELALGRNSIADLSALSGLTNLTSLGVWDNNLTSLSGIESLTGLTYLDFSDNQVSDLSPLTGLTALTELWMYGNNVSDVSPLTSLTNLTVLMLRDNPVENGEELRAIYPKLTRIDVDVLNLGEAVNSDEEE